MRNCNGTICSIIVICTINTVTAILLLLLLGIISIGAISTTNSSEPGSFKQGHGWHFIVGAAFKN